MTIFGRLIILIGLCCFSPFAGASSSSPSALVGSSVIYQSGDTALLPCDVSVPKPRGNDGGNGAGGAKGDNAADELRLIMWYREDVKSPIYRDVLISPQLLCPAASPVCSLRVRVRNLEYPTDRLLFLNQLPDRTRFACRLAHPAPSCHSMRSLVFKLFKCS